MKWIKWIMKIMWNNVIMKEMNNERKWNENNEIMKY